MDDNKYLGKQIQRLDQKKELLISQPQFQKDILELRKKWKIPSGGLKTADVLEKWYHRHYEDDDKYVEETWPKYQREFKRLREEKKFREVEELNKRLNDANPVNALRIDVKNLVKKYNLGPQWFESVKAYLLSNKLVGMFLGLAIRVERDKDNDQEKILLEINEDTTKEDVVKIWPTIKFHQKRLSYRKQEKYQPIRNLKLYGRIAELADEHKNYEEIASTIRDEFKIDFGYDDVSRALRRYRKRVGQQ